MWLRTPPPPGSKRFSPFPLSPPPPPRSAEVMDVRPDGGCNIHTRSLKYGKLANGMLAVVHPALVKRCDPPSMPPPKEEGGWCCRTSGKRDWAIAPLNIDGEPSNWEECGDAPFAHHAKHHPIPSRVVPVSYQSSEASGRNSSD